MSLLVRAVLLLVGAVHLLPVIGVLGATRLEPMYGVALPDPQVVLLLRHRAVLFGLIGTLLCGASFHAPWQTSALWVGLCSTASFVVLAWLGADLGPPLRRVLTVDIGAVILLAAALVGRLTLPAPG